MDEDLESLSREELVAELVRLRNAVRAHRDTSMHDLCWHHPDLWDLLPEKSAIHPWCRSGLFSCGAVSGIGSRWTNSCPTHRDRRMSIRVGKAADGPVVHLALISFSSQSLNATALAGMRLRGATK